MKNFVGFSFGNLGENNPLERLVNSYFIIDIALERLVYSYFFIDIAIYVYFLEFFVVLLMRYPNRNIREKRVRMTQIKYLELDN